jgi:segregation and condensation protein B
MSTKPGRRSSIRELKPGASKKRGERLQAEAVGEVAPLAEPLTADDAEPASDESLDAAVSSTDASEEPRGPEVSAPDAPTYDDAAPDEGALEGEASSDDDESEPSAIEAAMLAELSAGVADNTEAFLEGLIEALLFSSDRPMPAKELARAAGIDRRRAEELVAALRRRYEAGGLSIEEVAGGFVMRSSPRYATYIQKLLALRPVRLSRAQLETLAIVAYRQPVTKPEVDDIRGVDSGQVLKGLLERELLKILGKKDEPGRPMLYGTTTTFLELLNLQSLKDLPTLREYTELSEESRQKFVDETGDESPEAVLSEEGLVAAAGVASAEATGSGAGDEEAPVEPASLNPTPDTAPEAQPTGAEAASAAADEADTAPDEADAAADEAEAAAERRGAALADENAVPDDDAEEGIDLDALADDFDEEPAPASR